MGMVEGVRLAGLRKSYDSPSGPIEAVRGVDVDDAPGETVALLGPNGAGQVDHDRHAARPARPDAGTVRCSAARRRAAIAAGRVGAMLQTGGAAARPHGRELLAMMASLYPGRSTSTRCSTSTGLTDDRRAADRRSSPAARRSGCASPSRWSANPDLLVLDEPTVAMDVEGRHAFWATMRDFAARGHDDRVRHALPRGGGRLRRPRRPHGARRGRGRRARRPRSRRASGRARSARRCPASVEAPRALPGVDRRRAPRRRDRARAAPTPTRRSAPCSRVPRRRATSRSPAPASRRPSWS